MVALQQLPVSHTAYKDAGAQRMCTSITPTADACFQQPQQLDEPIGGCLPEPAHMCDLAADLRTLPCPQALPLHQDLGAG